MGSTAVRYMLLYSCVLVLFHLFPLVVRVCYIVPIPVASRLSSARPYLPCNDVGGQPKVSRAFVQCEEDLSMHAQYTGID